MPEKNLKEPLLPENKLGKIGCIVLLVILFDLAICFIGVIYLGFLSFFGFYYSSFQNVIVFLLLLLVISTIYEGILFVVKSFFIHIGLTVKQAFIIEALLEFQGVFFIVHILDEKMETISVSNSTEALFAISLFLLYIVNESFTKKK